MINLDTEMEDTAEEINEKISDETTIQQSTIELTETISTDTEYTLPLYYQVGNNSLELYYCGEKLIKDVHYSEVGTSGNTSNIITFISDLEYIDMSDIDEFEDFTATLDVIIRGNYE